MNLRKRGDARIGAGIGALGIQVMLRWPHLGFQGCTGVVGTLAVTPCLLSAYLRSSGCIRTAARWLFAAGVALLFIGVAPIALGGLEAQHEVSQGLAAAQGAVAAVSDGTTAPATADLTLATADFSDAHRSTGEWWTAAARIVPVVAQQRQALARATAIGQHVTSIARSEAGRVRYESLRYEDGDMNLAALEGMTAPLQRLSTALGSGTRQLASISDPWLLHPLSRRIAEFQQELASADRKTSLATLATSRLPAILGASGTRRYLVALETPSESRGLGGYIGAYAELKITNGHVTLSRAGNTMTDLDHTDVARRHLTGPPTFVADFGSSGHVVDFFGNLSVAPDLPTTTDVISQIYPEAGGDHIDGVLAIDPYGLAALLKLTGPISVHGIPQPLTSANAAYILLEQQYDDFANSEGTVRHDYLSDALRAGLSRLLSEALPGPRRLADDLDSVVQEDRLVFWTTHPADQGFIRQIHLAGAFPSAAGGDLVSVVTDNQANNKIDSFLYRSITDRVIVDPSTGKVHATVTVILHNDAPANGLPAYVIGSFPGSGLPIGTNFLSLTVYSPLALVSATEDGSDFPFGHQHEFGVSAYTTADYLASGSSDIFVLHLTGVLAPTAGYQLTVHQQPLVNRDMATVDLSTTPGWAVAGYRSGVAWTLGTASDELFRAKFVRTRA
jgi:hypothetical protein